MSHPRDIEDTAEDRRGRQVRPLPLALQKLQIIREGGLAKLWTAMSARTGTPCHAQNFSPPLIFRGGDSSIGDARARRGRRYPAWRA